MNPDEAMYYRGSLTRETIVLELNSTGLTMARSAGDPVYLSSYLTSSSYRRLPRDAIISYAQANRET